MSNFSENLSRKFRTLSALTVASAALFWGETATKAHAQSDSAVVKSEMLIKMADNVPVRYQKMFFSDQFAHHISQMARAKIFVFPVVEKYAKLDAAGKKEWREIEKQTKEIEKQLRSVFFKVNGAMNDVAGARTKHHIALLRGNPWGDGDFIPSLIEKYNKIEREQRHVVSDMTPTIDAYTTQVNAFLTKERVSLNQCALSDKTLANALDDMDKGWHTWGNVIKLENNKKTWGLGSYIAMEKQPRIGYFDPIVGIDAGFKLRHLTTSVQMVQRSIIPYSSQTTEKQPLKD